MGIREVNEIRATFWKAINRWIGDNGRVTILESESWLSSYEAIERCEMQLERDWESTGGRS